MRQWGWSVWGVCLALAWPLSLSAADLEKGKEINGTCAACHGELGAGGKKGEYPRIAGQRVSYLESQLRNFRSRVRLNIPMFPYTQERELSDEDIRDVSAFLSKIVLETKMPTYTGQEDALTRLQMAEKVMIIPRAEGQVDKGRDIFQSRCSTCHGTDARGRGMVPMLVGQYTQYLRRQIDAYLGGERPHDEDGTRGELNNLQPDDIQNVLAYLTTLQD